MANESQLAALTESLREDEEITLGPTDAAACADALAFYVGSRQRRRSRYIFAGWLVLAAIIVSPAFGIVADLNRDGRVDAGDAHVLVARMFDDYQVTKTFVYNGKRYKVVFQQPMNGGDFNVVEIDTYQEARRVVLE